MPGERALVKISSKNYLTMLLPFSMLVAAKLYIQNKAPNPSDLGPLIL